MPRAAEPQRFDPGRWLNWAERLGYRLYLAENDSDGRLGIVTEIPKGGPRNAEHLELWRAFQGQASERKLNRVALIEHLVKIGRVVGGPCRAEPASRTPTNHDLND